MDTLPNEILDMIYKLITDPSSARTFALLFSRCASVAKNEIEAAKVRLSKKIKVSLDYLKVGLMIKSSEFGALTGYKTVLPNGDLHGRYVIRNLYDFVIEKADYRDGKKHGKFFRCSCAGSRAVKKGMYVNGKREGKWVILPKGHYPSIRKGEYVGGVKEGLWIDCVYETLKALPLGFCNHGEGDEICVAIYYYRNGLLHGTRKTTFGSNFEEPIVAYSEYENGVLVGPKYYYLREPGYLIARRKSCDAPLEYMSEYTQPEDITSRYEDAIPWSGED